MSRARPGCWRDSESGTATSSNGTTPWLDRCQRESANLRSAIRWAVEAGEAEMGLRMAAALWRFWHQRGPVWEGRRVLDQLLEFGGSSPGVRAKALGAAGGLAWWGGS